MHRLIPGVASKTSTWYCRYGKLFEAPGHPISLITQCFNIIQWWWWRSRRWTWWVWALYSQ